MNTPDPGPTRAAKRLAAVVPLASPGLPFSIPPSRFKLSDGKSDGKEVIVVREGTAVNFVLESTPAEVIDLVFSEMMLCLLLLLENPTQYPPGRIHQAPADRVDVIARGWLRDVNV